MRWLPIDILVTLSPQSESQTMIQPDSPQVVFAHDEMDACQTDFIKAFFQCFRSNDPAQSLTGFI